MEIIIIALIAVEASLVRGCLRGSFWVRTEVCLLHRLSGVIGRVLWTLSASFPPFQSTTQFPRSLHIALTEQDLHLHFPINFPPILFHLDGPPLSLKSMFQPHSRARICLWRCHGTMRWRSHEPRHISQRLNLQ